MKGDHENRFEISPKTGVYTVLIFGLLGISFITINLGYIYGVFFSLLPLVIFTFFYCIRNPFWALTIIFVVNYFIMMIIRYTPGLQGGIMIDALIGFCIFTLIIRACYRNIDLSRAKNSLTLIATIWLGYCLLELLNPQASSLKAWAVSIRGVAIYFFMITIISTIIFYRYKDLKRILYVWSILTLIAAAKALIQKYVGFDATELRWLNEGGSTTHIIHSGTRYFSIFSDAANFGAGMGFSMVVFTICALVFKKSKIRYYFFAVALAAAYSMIISGTRGAMAVPFAGFILYILISKNGKIITIGTLALVAIFVFLNFTSIGHANANIRRMRSAFNMEDASLLVRLENQKKIRVYMKDKPFGVGMGLGGGKAKVFAPNAPMSQIPTDSWYVMIWVETGIVGLLLHISILLYIVGYGIHMVMFKIKDPELKGLLSAYLCGIFGIIVCSYGNEILGQFPTGIIVYIGMSFLFIGETMDKEIAEKRIHDDHEYNLSH